MESKEEYRVKRELSSMEKVEEIRKVTEEIKLYDYSYVVRFLNENTRFDGTNINKQKDDLVKSVDTLLSLIDRYEQLIAYIDNIVKEMRKPVKATESGATKQILIETLLEKYMYYRQYPNELSSLLKALEEK